MTSQVKHLHRALAAALLLVAVVTTARADPDALTILRDTRMAQASQDRTLSGHLRVQATGRIVPFTLVLSGSTIRYDFKDADIILRLGEEGSQLLETTGGDLRKVSPARYDKPVEGTDITYEDVSLNFLYWKKAKIDGSETVDGLNCWKLHVEPAGQPSAYAVVLLWVPKRGGAFVEGEGYNGAGKLVKRFRVVSGQHDPNGGWMLKEMKIATLAEGKPESVTYLEIDKQPVPNSGG